MSSVDPIDVTAHFWLDEADGDSVGFDLLCSALSERIKEIEISRGTVPKDASELEEI